MVRTGGGGVAGWSVTLIAAVAVLAVTACQEEPYAVVGGGGFIFNYRIGEATWGTVVDLRREPPAGAVLHASFDNPAGGPPIIVAMPVEPGVKRYRPTTGPLEGVEAGKPYRFVLEIKDAEGKVLERHEKTYVSDIGQERLPDQPLTTGPGYARTPAGEALIRK